MERKHTYRIGLTWTGNLGDGTRGYAGYSRDHLIQAEGKPQLPGSSDPLFRGDATRYNPEELLIASLCSCHMLWYLHLCADSGVEVVEYADQAVGEMVETKVGGRFASVTLHPLVVLAPGGSLNRARQLHEDAHAHCFIANSVNFPVLCEPTIRAAGDAVRMTAPESSPNDFQESGG